MTVKLTKKVVNRLSFPDKGQVLVWDKALSGFGVRLTPSRKTYIVQARVNGKTRRFTVGVHGVIAADAAREKALRLLGEMAEGKDPGEGKRKKVLSSLTLRQVADAYIEGKRTKKGHLLKQASKNDIDRHVKTTFSDWEDKPLVSIDRHMVLKRYQQASAASEAQANQAFRILRAIWNWQRNNTKDKKSGNPTMPENPCAAITDSNGWAYVPSRDRAIPLYKIGSVWNHLEALRSDPGQTTVGQTMIAAVQFAMLTGGRWGEIAPLTWKQIDFDAATWTLPDPKNRRKITFPLSRQALAILHDQAGKHDTFIFPGRGKDGHIHRPTRLMKKIADDCGVTVSPHDLRRTFNAIAEDCGVEFWKQKVLLGHTVAADVTLNNYKQTNDLTRLAPDAQKIADWIERKAVESRNKVVDMQQAREAANNG